MSLKEMLIATGGGGLHDNPKTVFKLGTKGLVGAQNNTFVDSSPANNAITRYGNATQGTFTPYSKEAGKWSNWFGGTAGGYLSATALQTLGTSDFEIEFDLFAVSQQSADGAVLDLRSSSSSTTGIVVAVRNSDSIVYIKAGSTVITVSALALPKNQWAKVKVTRTNNVLDVIINGVSATTKGTSTNSFTDTKINIGASSNYANSGFGGYISNLIVKKGETGSQVAVIDTCKYNRFKDNSIYNHTLTPTGNVKVSPFSPYANSGNYDAMAYGGSAYFDGNEDFLTIPSTNINVLTGDFVITFSFNVPRDVYLIAQWVQQVGYGGFILGLSGGKLLTSLGTYSENNAFLTSTNSVLYNCFNEASFSRVGNNWYLTLNGQTVTANHTGTRSLPSVPISIGAYYDPSWVLGVGTHLNGYLSNLRITKAGSEVLNLKFNNAGISDESGMNNIETVGDAKVSSDGQGVVFDGVNDLLIVNTTDNYAVGAIFSTSIEFYPTAQSGTLIRSKVGTTGLGIGWQDATHFGIQDNGTWKLTTTTMPNLNAWNTLVITRTGTGANQTTMTLNGNTVTGTVDSAWITPTAYSIGCASDLTSDFNGTIKKLTITKG